MNARTITFIALLFGLNLHAQLDDTTKAKLTGNWSGDLNVPDAAITLRLVFDVTEDTTGKLAATFGSPDQGAYDIATRGIEKTDGKFLIKVPAVGGRLEFSYIDSNKTWDGTWKQGGRDFDIVFSKYSPGEQKQKATATGRPQEPEPPYPYFENNIRFFNAEDSINLAGTLTLPDTSGKYPAVVLISGSGPHNRNGEMMGHKPFLVIADHLVRQGIAVLRFDDRGVGESEGRFEQATTSDFATDATSAIDFLQNHPNIDTTGLGLIGHSEGGLVAPMAANRHSAVDFIVLIAGPAVPGDTILMAQSRLLLEQSGNASEEMIDMQENFQKQLFSCIRRGETAHWSVDRMQDSLSGIYDRLPKKDKEMLQMSGVQISQSVSQLTSPWMRMFLTYNPRQDIGKLDIPVLAIFGENDMQVPPSVAGNPMEQTLHQAPTEDFEVVVYEGLNHLMQPSETGSPAEYRTINETFSPKVLEKVSNWILHHTKK